IAKGSCAEVRSQLYAALDNKYIDASEFQSAQELAVRSSKVIGALRASISRRQNTDNA
ncbi:MAG: four helix bundle protein, partial [Gammaproteobacteria bacterium]|nr:four helix bundle protein [Gammaproteobacteria bacterium]